MPLSSSTPAAGDALRPTIDWSTGAAGIAAACDKQIAQADGQAKTVGAIPAAEGTFARVTAPLENLAADLNDTLAAEQFLYNVSGDAAVRKASLACSTKVNDYMTELNARPELYRALRGAKASGTATSDADKKVLALWLVATERSGAGLDDAKRAEFVRLSKQLNDLQNRFTSNIGEDKTTISISARQTAGLHTDFTATFKRNGAMYVVPANESTSASFMQNASDESARKMFYLAYQNRASTTNVALLQQAIAVRDRLAHIFGYPTWAAYVLADHMAGTPKRVEDFLGKLDRRILPVARAENATLAAMKHAPIAAWDSAYYTNQLLKTKYAVDENAVRQYFPVAHTVDAVLAIYSQLLGVAFTKQNAPLWNAEVLSYDVHDAASNRYIGTFALDLFPRPGKYAHFASFPILPTRTLADGRVRAPFAVIVGNWPRPAAGAPALLSHDDVETFFHEFGHNMAAMLANTPYETLNAGFRQDFVEAPSQMLENWVWDPGILRQLSANVKTGEPLPDTLMRKLIAARYVGFALATTRQIDYATVDMRYHTGGPSVDTTAVWAKTAKETTPTPFPPGIHPQASFGHLMGGYDAGYYGYLWSKVYAQDMFTAFEQGGLKSPQVGERYRRDILEPAREYEPDAEVARFLGRPMSAEAFYHEFALDPAAKGTGSAR